MPVCVLVVNDDSAFLELMNMLLTDEGMEVISLKESKTAFDRIKEEHPNLVILDIRLEHPESGWQLLQLIRLHPDTHDIPVIVCSADTRFLRDKEQQLEQKGCCILEKPFDLQELLATVKKALNPPNKEMK